MEYDILADICGKDNVLKNVSAAGISTFKVGGNIKYVVYPEGEATLLKILDFCKNKKHIVLGNGSNVVFCDNGYDGIVIVTSHMNKINVNENEIWAQCGAQMTKLALIAAEHSLTGLEFAYGIPGTVGGGAFMNAGAYGGEIKNVVKTVRVLCKDGNINEYCADECDYGYRHSRFMDDDSIVLEICFELEKGDTDEIKTVMSKNMAFRKEKQPLEYPSAGSVFKRPEGHFAGKLIQDNGLKGCKMGGAQVSEKHAGFIVNVGSATSDDIKRLVKHIQNTIYNANGVKLECEIRFID